MNASIELDQEDGRLRPFDELSGSVRWDGEAPADGAELRLFWITAGRGTEESMVIARQPIGPGGGRFRFELPDAPYSFSGTLVSVRWALELVVDDDEVAAARDFILSPTGGELRLEEVEKPPGRKGWKR